MSILEQALGHVCAHPAQADHSDLHDTLPRNRERFTDERFERLKRARRICVKVYAKASAVSRIERLQIAKRLGRKQRPETDLHPGNRKIVLHRSSDLNEEAAIGTAFMLLSGRM